MVFFKRDPVKRLDEQELRQMYLDGKRSEKLTTFYFMFVSFVITIGVTAISFSKHLYWILIFAIVGIIWFIHSITRLSRIIEEIFENREVEE